MTSRTITFAGFAVILVSIILVAVIAAHRAHWMSLPDAFGTLKRNRVVRILVVVGWVWLGWHLFARGSGAFE